MISNGIFKCSSLRGAALVGCAHGLRPCWASRHRGGALPGAESFREVKKRSKEYNIISYISNRDSYIMIL